MLSRKGRALWVLAIMSPTIAELCSGSSPPLEFFVPTSFALLLGLYGAGVLIVRELSVIWRTGWIGVLVLGAAYGILEEGVAIKSFFDSEWMDLGNLGVYGRYLGTNWVWAVWLTIYHSAISITLPIFILSLLYPDLKSERLLTKKTFNIVLVILFIDVLVCTTLLNDYAPLAPMYLLSIVAVFGLTLYAKHIPRSFLMPSRARPSWKPSTFFMIGFFFILFSFIISGIFSETALPPAVPIVLLLMISFYVILLIKHGIGLTDNKAQKAYFVSGILFFFVPFGILNELNGYPGMSVVAVATALFVMDLMRWSEGKRVRVYRVGSLLCGK
jgi:hypothetical protein